MAIRITGMYSGLDTESIISELASAQSVKKNKLVKAQTKLSWKQDAWKALNTKIFSFYTNVLGNMRYEGSYMKKATKVSNTNAVSVVTSADAPNNVQTMTVDKLAKQGALTGTQLTTDKDGNKVTASTTLEQLGMTGDGSISVKVGNSSVDISVTKDMKISDVVKKLQAAGINASFDSKNQRLYLNSKDSGAAANFTITSNDAGGKDVLSKLGLVAAYDKNSAEYKEYERWKNYGLSTSPMSPERAEAEKAALKKLIASKKESTDALLAANEEYQKRLDELRKINSEADSPYLEDMTADALYDALYGPEHEIVKTDADGNPVQTPKLDANGKPIQVQKTDSDGNPVFDAYGDPVMEYVMEDVKIKVRDGGAKKALDDAQAKLKEVMASDTATEQERKDAQDAVTQAQKNFNELSGKYSYIRSIENLEKAIDQNNTTIAANREYYEVDANGEPVLDGGGNLQPTQKAKDEVTKYFNDKITAAEKYLQDADAYLALSPEDQKAQASKYATRVEGQDAEITVNGVTYTNSKNTFEINGLTITAQQETAPGEEITLTTTEDTEGIYDMIKNFFTEYNKLINEMDAMYNADSSKGYEPLLSEEKAGLADSEIEEWEKKIKDSLLRRDATLRDVTDAIKTVMLQGTTVNGKKMYLSDFGINTLGYFKAADNEKGAYHINGDKDDGTVANEDDTLRAMIASDPASVQKFFAGLTKNLYETLTDKMKSVKDTSSAFTVYNDKTMQKEYDDYKDKIKKEETKLNNLIDSWYKKFSAMETAMAKLQSKNNAVSSMFGG